MWKLLFWMLLVGGLVYVVSKYWRGKDAVEQIQQQAEWVIDHARTSADSAVRISYRKAKEQELDSLDDALDRLWLSVPAIQDSTYSTWTQALTQAESKRKVLNEKLLYLDTLAAEHYEQARNKVEVGIRLLQEEMRRFEDNP